ncbi:MAG: hypothetical protein ACKO9H_05785, partial [Planctomycetota bacterium]
HRPEPVQFQVFPYSVAPGGTYSGEQARRRAAADPVVGEHYRGIDLNSPWLKSARPAEII